MAEKVDFLLASLRGQPPPEAPPSVEAQAAAAASEEQLAPLRSKVEELERKLAELSAPPAPPEGAEAPAEPPKPPTELMMFLHTRMELLERRLELAQQEALRANLVLREREEAQKKAQGEVEELFRSIREQERSARFDRRLREQYSATHSRVEELEARLAMAQLRMVPADEVLRSIEREEGLGELRSRLKEQLSRMSGGEPSVGAPAPAPPPAPPAGAPDRPEGPARPAQDAPFNYSELPPLSIVTAKIADLELRLAEAEKAREKERQSRLLWENNVLQALRQSSGRWQKAGGAGLLVEATLESMVELLKKRDLLAGETAQILDRLRSEPPGSGEEPLLRARLAELRKSIEELQGELDKKMAIVNAWTERNKGKD
ncbi:MAG: hypothetical protein HY922_12935 [Elusimicrobia bacterium]|nr:hypothetical protein [Elusimicrobiota bacterium]